MAVTSIAAGDVVAGIVTALRAATGFRAPTETGGSDIVVFDGAVESQSSNMQCVVVGSDGDPSSVQEPVRFQSEWHDMDLSMDEQGVIQCAIVVWSGDTDAISSQRTTIFGILEDVDAALRASIDAANLTVAQLLWCHVSGGVLMQGVTNDGTESRLPFTINYRALLQVT